MVKTLHQIVAELRYKDYKPKKAEGYDFYIIQETLREQALEHLKKMPKGALHDSLEEWIMKFFDIRKNEHGYYLGYPFGSQEHKKEGGSW